MSYIGNYHQLDPSLLKTLTGDAGGAVPATLNNIDILGGDNIGTVGVIAASTITVNLDKSIAQPVTNAAGTEGLYTLGGVDFISNYGTDNAFFGGAGNRTLTTATAIKNVAIGSQALTQITTAHENIAIGYNSLGSMISGGNSIAIGAEALLGVTATPGTNIAIGYNALKRVTTTCNNTAVGTNACVHLGWAGGNASQNSFFGFGSAPTMKNGDWNTGIGYETFTLMNLTATTGTCFNNLAAGAIAGYYWEDAEQGNIALGSLGRVGESNVIRIGNTQDTTLAVIPGPGPLNKQTKCFIAGIRGIVPVTADAQVVVIDSLGQLGTLASVWRNVTADTQALAVNSSYIANRVAGVLACTLPAVAAVGDSIAITGNLNGWTVAQNAGQTIHHLAASTTPGVGGSLASTTARDCAKLICVVADTDFVLEFMTGVVTLA